MDLNRRTFLKGALAAAAGSAIAPVFDSTMLLDANAQDADPLAGVSWHKAPCRFCGVGCGTEVGVRNGRAVAIRGDELSPVNKGLLCVKGYSLPMVLAGNDRLTQPMIRNGAGNLEEASWDDALDLIASRWQSYIEEFGPDSVAMFGSGQWTIPEGYAALKWLKGGIRTNNLEPNARFCMASAVVGYLTTFGIDEPAGTYDDFEKANAFVLWGANMAEMHPMLFNRIVRHRNASSGVSIISLQTYNHMTDEGADEQYLFEPHTDLLLANAIAHVLIREDWIDHDFIDRHTSFMQTVEGTNTKVSFDDYKRFIAEFDPEMVHDAIGGEIGVEEIESLARIYGDPDRNVISLWTMGMNQHTRGVWINNLVHNLHLLTGKMSKPGNCPLSLTGQPSACGTCREVGTFTHRLPSDRLVAKEEHRRECEEVWGLPAGTIPSPAESPLTHAVAMWGKFAAGEIKSIWVNTTNPLQTLPNLNEYLDRIRGNSDSLLIVSDVYPTVTTAEADVVLPSACWIEKEGMFGNTERRTHHFAKLIDAPGDAKPDVWQFVEVARRMGYDNLFPNDWDSALEENLYNEYRQLTLGTAHDIATYEQIKDSRGLRWPVKDGVETLIRFNREYDSYVSEDAADGIEFYGKPDGRAVIWLRPFEAPAESPDSQYPFWLCTGRMLEHWHTGTMTRRVASLHRAMPAAYCYLNKDDASRLGVSSGDKVRVTSRRGSVEFTYEKSSRVACPEGYVYIPFFDQEKLVNEITLGAIDPMSKQPDYKKCAVRLTKA